MNHTSEDRKKFMGIYRTPDNIENFKLRVFIKDISGFGAEEAVGRVFQGENKVFYWQQKVYGKFEREFYKDPKNCVSDLEQRYHRDVVAALNNEDVLFTYVDEDEFCASQEESCVTNSKLSTELCKEVNNLLQTKDGPAWFPKYSEGFNYRGSLVNSLNNPYGTLRNFQVMYIMADLGEYVDDNTWLKSEYVLGTIMYDRAHNVLQIFPDFTRAEPYHIEIEGDRKKVFQYRLEDASEKISSEEKEILNKIIRHETKVRLDKDVGHFELAPKNQLQVHLFVEILQGKNFEYDDVYVDYLIDLPANWSCKNQGDLRGTTPASRAKNRRFNFGFLIEVCLEHNVFHGLANSEGAKPLYIYFEIVSKDSWNRFRTEGLTYTSLPILQPGGYRYDLQCLRICPGGPSGELRRFFVGDYSNYDDITWISIPKDYEEKTIDKFGATTISTGQLSVRVNVVHQSQALMSDLGSDGDGAREKLGKLHVSDFAKSVQDVLRAFKNAKQKMIEARKNV